VSISSPPSYFIGSHVARYKPRQRNPNTASVNCQRAMFGFLLIGVLATVGCTGGGFPNPNATPASASVVVSPSSVVVAAGSNTSFIAVFTPTFPVGGSVTWAVAPPTGGTITNTGVYTASAIPGNYTVTVTWTPSTPAAGTKISSSAAVQVLPVPQQGVALNPDLTQASGGVQPSGAIENTAVVGQQFPAVTSVDASGHVQSQTGFSIPVACGGSNPVCP